MWTREGAGPEHQQPTVAHLNMVDLAGSEDLRRGGSGSEEVRLAEARAINSSLSTLGKVAMLLSSSSSGSASGHIPYRDSKLTRILKVAFAWCTACRSLIHACRSLTHAWRSLTHGHDCSNQQHMHW